MTFDPSSTLVQRRSLWTRFLTGLSLLAAATFIVAVWRWDVVDIPPYEDQAVGIWLEAEFLLETNFDYRRLRYEEPHYNENRGARSYMISAIPTLFALVMKTGADVRTVFMWSHGFEFLCAAAILTVMFISLRRPLGTWEAVLTTTAAATLPAFVVQMDMLGLDVPTTFFMLLAGWMTWEFRFGVAATASTAAFFMKPTGMLATLTTLSFVTLVLAAGRAVPTHVRQSAWRGLWINLAALAMQESMFLWGDPLPELRSSVQFPWLLRLPGAVAAYPDVGVLLATAALGSYAAFHRWKWALPQDSMESRLDYWRRLLGSLLLAEPMVVVSWIMILGLLAAMVRWLPAPRYFACAFPFLFAILGRLSFLGRISRSAGAVAFTTLIAVSLMNRDGRFYPHLEELSPELFDRYATFSPHSCVFSERSLEYLSDQESVMKAMAIIERESAGSVALVPDPYYWYVVRPRLGFVNKPVLAYPVRDYLETLRTLQATLPQWKDSSFPLMVWFGDARAILPPPDKATDEILYVGPEPAPLIVYRKRPPQKPWTQASMERWFIDSTWPGPYLPQRTLARTAYWNAAGTPFEALRELKSAIASDGARDWLHDFLTGMKLKVENDCVDQKIAGQLLKSSPKNRAAAEFPWLTTRAPAKAEQLIDVMDSLTGATAKSSNSPTDEELLIDAYNHARQGATTKSKGCLETLLKRNDRIAEAWGLRGDLAFQAQRMDEATTSWNKAASLNSNYAGAKYGLGVAAGRAGAGGTAADRMTEALVCNPADWGARNCLRRILFGRPNGMYAQP